VSYAIGGRTLFADLDFIFTAGSAWDWWVRMQRKTTLLRLLRGEMQPTGGEIRSRGLLPWVYFDQNRVLDPDVTLARALAPDSDAGFIRTEWCTCFVAARFLFTGEQLNQR